MSLLYRSGHQPTLHQASMPGSLDPQIFLQSLKICQFLNAEKRLTLVESLPFYTQSGNVSNLNHKMLNEGRQGGDTCLCTVPEYSQKNS